MRVRALREGVWVAEPDKVIAIPGGEAAAAGVILIPAPSSARSVVVIISPRTVAWRARPALDIEQLGRAGDLEPVTTNERVFKTKHIHLVRDGLAPRCGRQNATKERKLGEAVTLTHFTTCGRPQLEHFHLLVLHPGIRQG